LACTVSTLFYWCIGVVDAGKKLLHN